MASAIRDNSTYAGQPSIHADLASHEAPMKAALQRTAGFLGYIDKLTKGPPLSSVMLDAPIVQHVGVPDPIPPRERFIYQQQFRGWAVGQALIELDQSYQRFVVSSIETNSDIEHFKAHKTVCPAHKPNLANTWSVHEQFYSKSASTEPEHLDESRYLRSLGNARNCLAHDSGLVTERRLTDGDTMPIRWPGMDLYQVSDNGDRLLQPRDRPFKVRRKDVGKQLEWVQLVRERIYKAGDTIFFGPTDLSEIVFFYQTLAMRVGAELHRIVEEAGKELNA